MSDSQYYMASLSELRENALLLVMANAYLCEEQFLVKIGNSIDSSTQGLKSEISALKKEFPGKFVDEVDTDAILKKIQDTAQTMLKPGEEIIDRCVVGELGRKLESDVTSITEAINLIKNKVLGSGLTYTKKDSVFNLVGRLNNIWGSIGSVVTIGLKILICLFLIAIVGFLYLFFTMDSESDVLKEIAKSEAAISEQKEILSQLDQKKEEISRDIKSREKRYLARQEKIEILDLDMEIHKLEEGRTKAEAEISNHEKLIEDSKKRIEEMMNKSLIKRLLRQ